MKKYEENISKTNDPEQRQSRRGFIGQGVAAGLGLAALGQAVRAQETQPAAQAGGATSEAAALPKLTDLFPGAVDAKGEYVLPALPYAYDALEPHIDAETMTLHHDKHHAGYVKGLKAAEVALDEARSAGDFAHVEALTQKAAFHGAGHFLHCIFWASMTPEPGKPSTALSRALTRDFDSFDKFWEQFFAASKTVEGSGWGILAYSVPANKLVILQARNHQYATQWGNIPLLAIDVWEHAYYKKYSNMRGDYINAFRNVIDWAAVSQRYELIHSHAG